MAMLRSLTLVNFLIIYITIVSNVVSMKSVSSVNNPLTSSSDAEKPSYVAIIDAGSTGSRISAFTFHTSQTDGRLILDNEFYAQVQPGLSSYADNPHDGMATLKELIDEAKDQIPKSAWSSTPISIKATAGLRLLPKDKADAIIDECKSFIDKSGLYTTNNSVSIMEGIDEGIYAWVTINFLLRKLSSQEKVNTAAVLDSGGGSTQVTHSPDEDDLKTLDKKYIYNRKIFNQNTNLYTRSLLGMGIMASRQAILTHDLDIEAINATEIVEVRSECIYPTVLANWSYSGINYTVNGPSNDTHEVVETSAGEDRLTECMKIIREYVNNLTEKPVGLNKHDIYPISFYFDRAAEIGLIDPSTGGVVTLDDYYKAVMDTCNSPNTHHPFLCLDVTYIYILLHDGFGLGNSTKLHLYQDYHGHGFNWALGAAINLLDNEL